MQISYHCIYVKQFQIDTDRLITYRTESVSLSDRSGFQVEIQAAGIAQLRGNGSPFGRHTMLAAIIDAPRLQGNAGCHFGDDASYGV